MWIYEKKLQYPVKIKTPNPALAKVIMSQIGGPDGELSASMRYLHQRYAMPYRVGIATLTDIGTEELAHLEIVNAIVHQLTRCMTIYDIQREGFAEYYVDHTAGLWPQAAGGIAFTASQFQSKGDPITDLHENMAAEQKARTTYDNILRLLDDQDVIDPIRFLRAREVVHYQRFGETLRTVQDQLNSRNFYAFNPAFDRTRSNSRGNFGATNESDCDECLGNRRNGNGDDLLGNRREEERLGDCVDGNLRRASESVVLINCNNRCVNSGCVVGSTGCQDDIAERNATLSTSNCDDDCTK